MIFSWLTPLGNTDLQLVDTRPPPLLMGVCICLKAASPCGGSASAFCHCEGIEVTAASGFVNKDSFYTTPDLHSGKLFWRLRGRGGRKEEGDQGSKNKALQEAIITMRKEGINSHLQCIVYSEYHCTGRDSRFRFNPSVAHV